MGKEDATNIGGKRKVESTQPPDGYVCRLCSTPGHWIQVCPTKKTGTKKQKRSNHEYVPGKDPSPEDIEKARELQKIPPPKCFCGLPSRLNRVKRSREGGETSRAIGKYFFFCSKKRDDDTQCRFARPVEMEINKKKNYDSKLKAKGKKNAPDGEEQSKKKGAEKKAPKSEQICKFYAKNGSCKKGKKCEFSHDVQPNKHQFQPQRDNDKKGGDSKEDRSLNSEEKLSGYEERTRKGEESSKNKSSGNSSSDDTSSDSSTGDENLNNKHNNEATNDRVKGNSSDESDNSSSDDSNSSDSENDEVY